MAKERQPRTQPRYQLLSESDGVKASRPAIVSLILFLVFLLSTVSDFVMDWLFYTEVSALEKGLVYGETNPHAVRALLAFSIIGSIAFPFELFNLGYEFYKNEKTSPLIDSEVLSMLVVWLEDLPQVSISLYLAVCREEAISTIQLTKASFALAGISIRWVVSVVKVCRDRAHNHPKKIKIAIVVAICIQFCFTVGIFVLNNTDSGGKFKTPMTLSDHTYNDSQYFNNVSAFINIPQYFDDRDLDPYKKPSLVNWVQLTSVTNIRASHKPILFSFKLEKNGTDELKMAVWEKSAGVWSPPKCFLANLTSGLVTEEPNTTCESKGYFGNSTTEAFVTFWFNPPHGFFPNRIFGEIFFNMTIYENGICRGVSSYSDIVPQAGDTLQPIVMHYYRINLSMTGNQDYLVKSSDGFRFFSNDGKDLTDVTEAWKTGWGKCQTTGSLGPVLDPNINLKCNRS